MLDWLRRLVGGDGPDRDELPVARAPLPAVVAPTPAAAATKTPAAPGKGKSGELPDDYSAPILDLHNNRKIEKLPPKLSVRKLIIDGCINLKELPAGLLCIEVTARGSGLCRLPADLRVAYRLDLGECAHLEELPPGLSVGSLLLDGCPALQRLPEGLKTSFLDVSNCPSLEGWPDRGELRHGRLRAANCGWLTHLPSWIHEIAQLEVPGCLNLSALPEDLHVSSWLDFAGTGLTSLPEGCRGATLAWRGVPIDERIAFHPETLRVDEVLAEENAELRRVMLERVGFERFIRESDAEQLDRDTDAGGERRLLRVRIPGDEPLVCVSVLCPSTGRRYLLRVPPATKTCRQAIAWTAGFDKPDDYRPLAET